MGNLLKLSELKSIIKECIEEISLNEKKKKNRPKIQDFGIKDPLVYGGSIKRGDSTMYKQNGEYKVRKYGGHYYRVPSPSDIKWRNRKIFSVDEGPAREYRKKTGTKFHVSSHIERFPLNKRAERFKNNPEEKKNLKNIIVGDYLNGLKYKLKRSRTATEPIGKDEVYRDPLKTVIHKRGSYGKKIKKGYPFHTTKDSGSFKNLGKGK